MKFDQVIIFQFRANIDQIIVFQVERLGRAAQVPGRVFGLEGPADDHPAERGKLRQEAGARNAGERTKTFFLFHNIT